jgi:phosphopantetheinyl transferase (holo-ACP synthase)
MISAGNDIVDLRFVNKKRTADPRFYSKFISPAEEKLGHQSNLKILPFENYVWLLWSVKESAYKYLKRLQPDLLFAPAKILVNEIQDNSQPAVETNPTGDLLNEQIYNVTVSCGAHTLYFHSRVNADWIATIVNGTADFANTIHEVKKITSSDYKSQSTAVRRFLLAKIATVFEDEFTVEKSTDGYPVLWRNGMASDLIASMAHDGFYVSYSLNLDRVVEHQSESKLSAC